MNQRANNLCSIIYKVGRCLWQLRNIPDISGQPKLYISNVVYKLNQDGTFYTKDDIIGETAFLTFGCDCDQKECNCKLKVVCDTNDGIYKFIDTNKYSNNNCCIVDDTFNYEDTNQGYQYEYDNCNKCAKNVGSVDNIILEQPDLPFLCFCKKYKVTFDSYLQARPAVMVAKLQGATFDGIPMSDKSMQGSVSFLITSNKATYLTAFFQPNSLGLHFSASQTFHIPKVGRIAQRQITLPLSSRTPVPFDRNTMVLNALVSNKLMKLPFTPGPNFIDNISKIPTFTITRTLGTIVAIIVSNYVVPAGANAEFLSAGAANIDYRNIGSLQNTNIEAVKLHRLVDRLQTALNYSHGRLEDLLAPGVESSLGDTLILNSTDDLTKVLVQLIVTQASDFAGAPPVRILYPTTVTLLGPGPFESNRYSVVKNDNATAQSQQSDSNIIINWVQHVSSPIGRIPQSTDQVLTSKRRVSRSIIGDDLIV